ncbi:DUF1801 domain-containing protein [Tahibacter caeni]|uniref:DUF1801 domain-containing protein n=1 Tax=Tahibacter caeni TaxID=1453545 RepID=UPI0021494CC7|nr:DUF1801 domain-containing protein [Tahibacter caeni]
MSEPKTRPTETTLQTFLAGVSDAKRRADCAAVAVLMQQVTGEPAVIWGTSIVGFGRYRYRYESGREGDWPLIGFAARKNDLTLYVLFDFDGRDALLAKLGKHKTGKGCLYLKSLADVDRAVLEELIRRSVAAKEPQRVR